MRSTDCGLAIADCGLDTPASNPQSAIRNRQWLAGATLLVLLAAPTSAQQPASTPKDTTLLPPVVVTGVRANEPDAHEVNFDLLPLEDVERVEVVYGPSVLLGRNALGAAVNLVTRRGTSPASRELEASAGSYGRYELKTHVGARHGVWD